VNRRALPWIVLAVALAATGGVVAFRSCSGEGAGSSAGSIEADVIVLQEILGSDPARTVLGEVEQAVDDERPVLAASLIDEAALPRTRDQIERLEGAPAGTPEGRDLRTRAVRVHRARASALELYRDALQRGIGTEDMQLMDALRAYREAETDILALHAALEEIRPLAPEVEERQRREEAALGGLPPIRRDEASRHDDEALDPPPERDDTAGEPREPLPE
jgi:hypothetical protein